MNLLICSILAFLLPSLVAAKARLNIKPAGFKMERRAGDNVIFECKVVFDNGTDPAHRRIVSGPVWSFVDSKGHQETIGTAGRRRVKHINPTTILLLVSKSVVEDSGSYKCSVNVVDKEKTENEASLLIYDGIQLVDFQNEVHPVEGQDARLETKVVGDYKPQVHWYRVNRTVENDDDVMIDQQQQSDHYQFDNDGQVLIIKNFSKQFDDGDYKSSIFNVELGDMKDFTISVIAYVKPEILNLSSSGKFVEGRNADFSCEASGFPKPNVKWIKYLAESKDYRVPKDGLLEVLDFGPEDTGVYVCEVENAAGLMRREITAYDLYRKPKIEPLIGKAIQRDQSFELDCQFGGSQFLAAEWRFNGSVISQLTPSDDPNQSQRKYVIREVKTDANKLTLKIESGQIEDNGEYECFVENDAGNTSEKVLLVVEHKPIVVARDIQLIRASAVQPVEISCTAEASPQVKWTWFKYNEELNDDENFTIETSPKERITKLRIARAYGNYGIYKCRAENAHGADEKIFNVAMSNGQ